MWRLSWKHPWDEGFTRVWGARVFVIGSLVVAWYLAGLIVSVIV